MLEIDHVVLAVTDLDEAAGRLRDTTGLGSVAGGTHPRWGTANRIVPLGRQYVELIAVRHPQHARSTGFGRRVAAAAGSGRPWVTWVVRTDELDRVAARRGLEVDEGSRDRPDGRVLRWRMAGLDEALAAPPMPFFQEWSVPSAEHPGAEAADHLVRPLGIAWIEVAGDKARLMEWLDGAPRSVRIVAGDPGVVRIGIATEQGELVLGGGEVSPGRP